MKTNPPPESRYVKVARIAYELAKRSVARYSHPKSPHRFTQLQLVACLLLTFYLDLSYRVVSRRSVGEANIVEQLRLPTQWGTLPNICLAINRNQI